MFDRWDYNGNGVLSLAEIDKAAVELYPGAVLCCSFSTVFPLFYAVFILFRTVFTLYLHCFYTVFTLFYAVFTLFLQVWTTSLRSCERTKQRISLATS